MMVYMYLEQWDKTAEISDTFLSYVTFIAMVCFPPRINNVFIDMSFVENRLDDVRLWINTLPKHSNYYGHYGSFMPFRMLIIINLIILLFDTKSAILVMS